MATVVPARQRTTNYGSDVLQFALGLAGLKQEKELETRRMDILEKGQAFNEYRFGKEFQQETARMGLQERAVAVNEEEAAMTKEKLPLVMDYLKQQALQMQANTQTENEIRELRREADVARIAGQKEQTRALKLEADTLEAMTPEERKEKMLVGVSKQIIDQQRAEIYSLGQQVNAMNAFSLMQDRAQKAKSAQWENLFGDWSQSLKDTPLYGEFMAQSQMYLSAPDEQKPEIWKSLTETSRESVKLKQDQELAIRGQETGQQQKKETAILATRELIDQPEAFLNEAEFKKYQAAVQRGETPNIEEVPAGVLNWLGLPTNKRKFIVRSKNSQGEERSLEDILNELRSNK